MDWGEAIPYRPAELSYIKTIPPTIVDVPREATVRTRCIGDRSTILEHSHPTRNQVRKSNYDRRTEQKTREGFVSLKQKPYRAIGDPVYLNTKHLISDALGLTYQHDEELIEDRPNTPTLSELQEQNKAHTRQSAQAILIRRSRRNLNTLKKELDRGRSLLRNVRLGHDLFIALQDEWTKTMSKREREAAIEKERSMMDWQMARSDEDSDYDSDDLEQNDHNDLEKYIVRLDIPVYENDEVDTTDKTKSDPYSIRPETHQGVHFHSDREPNDVPGRLKSAPISRAHRHRGQPPRPYTPLYNNISYTRKHHTNHVVGETLFRQLCCLHWILKTMDMPETSIMSPIINCWKMNGDLMGGIELNRKELEEKLKREKEEYDEIVKVPKQKEVKRNRPKVDKKRSTSFFQPRYLRSRSGSLAPSQASNEAPTTPATDNIYASLKDHRAEPDIQEDKSVESYPTQAPETVPSPVVPALPTKKNLQASKQNLPQNLPASRTTNQSQQHTLQLTREELKEQELARQLEEVAKMDSTPMERLSHCRQYKATDKLKPKSSRKLLEFKDSCRSSQLQHKSTELKQSWNEVKEERALRLHDQLDYQEKYRLQTCRNKFNAMSTTSNSLHRALKDMRLKNEYKRREDEKERNKKQDQSKYAKWFDDLTNMIPEEYTNQWYIIAIIDKLRLFGIQYGPDNKTESSSKASENKFTRVLKLIRPWEICSPNIAAAVEFCRDRVIEMNEEEFEPIIQHLFPTVDRPKTAPPKSVSNSADPVTKHS